MSKDWIVAWSSGGKPSVALYMCKKNDSWGCTTDRMKALIFKTAFAAKRFWDSKHVDPGRYKDSWDAGYIRVEPFNQPMFNFNRRTNE